MGWRARNEQCATSPRALLALPLPALHPKSGLPDFGKNLGRSRINPTSVERVGVRGLSASHEPADRPPHPDPLPLKGEREREHICEWPTASSHQSCTLANT